MDENLIGYLLQALDEPEQRAVEAELRSQPTRLAHLNSLRRVLAPLALDAEPPAPPPNLTIHTLAVVAEHCCPSLPYPPALPLRQSGGRQWVRRVDLLAAACLLVVIGGLSLPWVAHLWHAGQRTACQGNLRQYWGALQSYCDSHNHELPQIGERGPQNYAGRFVGTLHEAGCLPSGNDLNCQGVGMKETAPTEAEVDRLASQPEHRAEFAQRARQLAGHYAYSLGYKENGSLHGPKWGDYQPILADHRPEETVGANSPNHGSRGQNILSVGGNVRFATTPYLTPGDNLYLNRDGKSRAGVDHEDTVLGSGETRP